MKRKYVQQFFSALLVVSLTVGNTGVLTSYAANAETSGALMELEVNNLTQPIGISNDTPTFSWMIQSTDTDVVQSQYQIIVRKGNADGEIVWDSGNVSSNQTQDITYAGTALEPMTKYYWSASSWNAEGELIATESSDFETGLDKENGWDGSKWITLDYDSVDYGVRNYKISADITFNDSAESGFTSLLYNYQDVNNYYYMKFKANEDGTITYAPCIETGTEQGAFSDNEIYLIGENTAFDKDKIPQTQEEQDEVMKSVFKTVEGVSVGTPFHVEVSVDLENNEIVTTVNDVEIDRISDVKCAFIPGALGWPSMEFEPGSVLTADNYENFLSLGYGKAGFKQKSSSNVSYDNVHIEADDQVTLDENFDDGVNHFSDGKVEDGQLVMASHAGDYDRLIIQEEFDGLSAPILRKKFNIDKEIESARLYSTALGLYDTQINNERVGYTDPSSGEIKYGEMQPDWTEYKYTLTYQTYDITDYLKSGENVLGVTLGAGWYQGRICRASYGADEPEFLGKIVINYTDGTQEVINSDESWEAYANGPITSNDIWDGICYDANKEIALDDDSLDWMNVDDTFEYSGELLPQMGEPVAVIGELSDVELMDSNEEGTFYQYDFKQNFVGYEVMEIEAEPGTRIEVNHGEMLNDQASVENGSADGEEGTVYTENLRTAKAKEVYVVGPSGTITTKPSFTFFGFQYITVESDKPVKINSIIGKVVSSDLKKTMNVETNNEEVNQLLSNIYWGQISNYLSVPTDCPQRDERLGYSGDTNVFIGAASYNLDIQNFIQRFSRTSYDSGREYDGLIGAVVPIIAGNSGYWGWSESAIFSPWQCYRQYGDLSVLAEEYEGMKAYMDYRENVEGINEDYTVSGMALRDHLAPTEEDYGEIYKDTTMTKESISYILAVMDANIMKKAAALLGKDEDAAHYEEVENGIKAKYRELFMNEDGTLTDATQGAYAMAVMADIFKPEEYEVAAKELIAKIEATDNKIATGFVSTRWLLLALSKLGCDEKAYDLLLQNEAPSWLYEVEQGANTIWERWNAYNEETGFGDVSMNSFNHYAFGTVGEWMYAYMSGIESGDEGGYQNFVLQPVIDPKNRINTVNASYDSTYGTIVSNWESGDNGITKYEATVPANTNATLYLEISEDQAKTLDLPEGAEFLGMENHNGKERAKFALDSGSYVFNF